MKKELQQWQKDALMDIEISKKVIDARTFLEDNGFYVFRDDEFVDMVTEITQRLNGVMYDILQKSYRNAKIKNRTYMCSYADYGEHLLEK